MNTFDIILSSPAATAILILFLGSGLSLTVAIVIGTWLRGIKVSPRRRRRHHSAALRAAG
jgi:hypothetical protein